MNQNTDKKAITPRSEGTQDRSNEFYEKVQSRSDANLWELLVSASTATEYVKAGTGRFAAPEWSNRLEGYRDCLALFEEYSLDTLLRMRDEFYLSATEWDVLDLLLEKRGAEYGLRKRGLLSGT